MGWVQIGLATIAATVPSIAAFGLIVLLQKRRAAAVPQGQGLERRRANRIAASLGVGPLHLLQLVAGLAAIAPGLALAGAIIDRAIDLPSAEALLGWIALYVGGWAVFGWCIRITDALKD